MAIQIRLLEMHAAHVCNLTCESCSHFSSNGHQGFVDLADAAAWLKSWQRRIVPGFFRIVGGEPTLNPHLPALIDLVAQNWPAARIGLTTNGFFLHRHPALPDVLSKHRVILRLTVHHRSQEYLARVRAILALLQEWRTGRFFEVVMEEASERWTRRYHGFGAGVLPYEDGDPRQSWEHCPCKNCLQLFRGRLWKCSPIAYLRLQKEAYPDISAQWDRYLAYQGLGPDCSAGELLDFLGRQDESICAMCASTPHPFAKPSPLIPLGVLKREAVAQAAPAAYAPPEESLG